MIVCLYCVRISILSTFLTSCIFQLSPPLKRPSALTVNDEDLVFVKDDRCIRVFDKTGAFLKNIGESVFVRPFGKKIIESRKSNEPNNDLEVA